MVRPRITRVGSGLAAAAVGAGLLALGTAAAPATRQHVRTAHPRLVATPKHLLPATELAPGDRVERLVDLRVHGRGRFRRVYFQARARSSSALDTDAQNGLQISIDRCTKRWRSRGRADTCAGKRTVVLAQRPLVGRWRLKLGTLTRRKIAHLRLVLVFPPSAGAGLERQETDATYRFVGVR